MKRFILFLFLVSMVMLFSQEEILVTKAVLFYDRGEAPLFITPSENWETIGMADLGINKSILESKKEGGDYRLRFRVHVEDSLNTDASMLQMRFIQADRISFFNLDLAGRDLHDEQRYTNWFLPPESFVNESWRGPVSVRLISAPGKNSEIQLTEIELEVWAEREVSRAPRPVLADGGTFIMPSREIVSSDNHSDLSVLHSSEALNFSLDFMKSVIEGDLPEFYASLAENIYSLNTGNSYSRYRLSPPAGYPSASLEDYKRNYSYTLYSYHQFIELFPQWAEQSRNWNPDENTYLFIGNTTRTDTAGFLNDNEMLVFMVGKVKGEIKVIARPEF